jgi:hypothetical protein
VVIPCDSIATRTAASIGVELLVLEAREVAVAARLRQAAAVLHRPRDEVIDLRIGELDDGTHADLRVTVRERERESITTE